jgi:hypothetical protein
MKRGGGDEITRIFSARADYPVRFPDSTHEEDKQLLRALVQYCAEELATKTRSVEGVDRRQVYTGFEYAIVHTKNDKRDYYALTFHLAYNVMLEEKCLEALKVMSSYWWGSWTFDTNWMVSRKELILVIKSKHEMSYTEQPRIFSWNPASTPQPSLPLPPPAPSPSPAPAFHPGTPQTPLEDDEGWFGWIPRPFKHRRYN